MKANLFFLIVLYYFIGENQAMSGQASEQGMSEQARFDQYIDLTILGLGSPVGHFGITYNQKFISSPLWIQGGIGEGSSGDHLAVNGLYDFFENEGWYSSIYLGFSYSTGHSVENSSHTGDFFWSNTGWQLSYQGDSGMRYSMELGFTSILAREIFKKDTDINPEGHLLAGLDPRLYRTGQTLPQISLLKIGYAF